MKYYSIRIFPESWNMTKIVTEFGKFRSNRHPMGVCSSGDIFQAKLDKILGDIMGIKTYIKDILLLFKEILSEQIEQPRIIFGRFFTTVLKVNSFKCSFLLKDITYLGYFITREGIKPGPNKVQGIMDLWRPTTTTEVQALISMVHYYRDMWTRRSHILVPLTEEFSDPKSRKIL